MPRKRTHEYNEDEVNRLMETKDISERQARFVLYHRDYNKQYYENNKEDRLEYFRDYRKKHKED